LRIRDSFKGKAGSGGEREDSTPEKFSFVRVLGGRDVLGKEGK